MLKKNYTDAQLRNDTIFPHFCSAYGAYHVFCQIFNFLIYYFLRKLLMLVLVLFNLHL